jgi:hypothetical protein
MANDGEQDPGRAFTMENEADLLFGRANPNPDRIGCPPRESLIALARRQLPVGDPVGDHVMRCSPCYRDVRAIQQAEGIRPAEERRPARSWWPAAAAAVLVVAAGLAAWFAYGPRQPAPTPPPEQVVANAEPVEVTLDLRKYGVTRSDAPAEELPPLVLPRAMVRLTLLLPVGSEEGEYEVRVVDTAGRVLADARGDAEIQEFIARMRLSIDLTSLTSRVSELQLRWRGHEWQRFPVGAAATR